MITLLVKIMHKYERRGEDSANKIKNIPIFKLKKEINESRIGGEYYFISNLLNKAALLSSNCERAIEEALEEIRITSLLMIENLIINDGKPK